MEHRCQTRDLKTSLCTSQQGSDHSCITQVHLLAWYGRTHFEAFQFRFRAGEIK